MTKNDIYTTLIKKWRNDEEISLATGVSRQMVSQRRNWHRPIAKHHYDKLYSFFYDQYEVVMDYLDKAWLKDN